MQSCGIYSEASEWLFGQRPVGAKELDCDAILRKSHRKQWVFLHTGFSTLRKTEAY